MKYLLSLFTLTFFSLSLFAQQEKLITETIAYDTIINVSIVKRTVTKTTFLNKKGKEEKTELSAPIEEIVSSEKIIFEDKNKQEKTINEAVSPTGSSPIPAPTTSEETEEASTAIVDRSRPAMAEGTDSKSAEEARKEAAKPSLSVSVIPKSEDEMEEVFKPEEKKMEDYSFPVIDDASRMAATITAIDLKKHLSVLASDAYEGRETGKEGQKKAANYIAEHFAKLGCPDFGEDKTYFQSYPLAAEQWDEISITVNDKSYEYLKDFYSFPSSNRSRGPVERDDVIFLGYGIDDPKYNDYKGVDVKNKVILVYQGEPMDRFQNSYITGKAETSEWTNDWRKKLETARKKGVKTVLLIEKDIPFYVSRYAYQLTEPVLIMDGADPAKKLINSCYISPDVAKEIIGSKYDKVISARDEIRKTGKPKSVKLKSDVTIIQREKKEDVLAENVMGFIRGSDPDVNDETIIITAHYDHLGKRADDIFNGADDNGSGTSAVLEIAEAFAQAKDKGIQPRRSILVIAVSGEEKGLLGSEHYVNNPVFPLEKTVANLNVDMIGRVDEKHLRNPNYVYVIGADRLSTTLDDINKSMNERYTKMELDYTFNERDDPNRFYYRSDHYNFAEKGIPAAFFFSGVHEDYHRATDTYDKIDYKKVERIARLVFMTAWELADREERIEVDRSGE